MYPEAVTPATGEDGSFMGVDYGRLSPALVKAVQELDAENRRLRARLDALEKMMEKL